jgi:hypothetical protein
LLISFQSARVLHANQHRVFVSFFIGLQNTWTHLVETLMDDDLWFFSSFGTLPFRAFLLYIIPSFSFYLSPSTLKKEKINLFGPSTLQYFFVWWFDPLKLIFFIITSSSTSCFYNSVLLYLFMGEDFNFKSKDHKNKRITIFYRRNLSNINNNNLQRILRGVAQLVRF